MPAEASPDLETLKRLYGQGKPEAAFEWAVKRRDELEGDSTFDFYYGLAAIDSGRVSEGVFALERVLA